MLAEALSKEFKNKEKLGAKNRTQTCFSQSFWPPPAISRQKSRDIPPKSLVSLKGHTELFGPHPFTWKTPTLPENIPTRKFRFTRFALFSRGIAQVSLRYPFCGGGGGFAPPLRMLSKGEALRKGGGGSAPNGPC